MTYLLGLSRSIFDLENALFRSSPFFVKSKFLTSKIKNSDFSPNLSYRLEIWDFGEDRLENKFTVIFGVTDLKIFQHEGGVRMAKIAFLLVKINPDHPKNHPIYILYLERYFFDLLKSKIK